MFSQFIFQKFYSFAFYIQVCYLFGVVFVKDSGSVSRPFFPRALYSVPFICPLSPMPHGLVYYSFIMQCLNFALLQYCVGYSGSRAFSNDCRYEIKKCLLLGRKAVTNLGSIIKSRGGTLSEKFCIVKAMVFLAVMYGCES